MKKIIAVAGVFALAACGGNEVDEPAEAEIAEPVVEATDTTAGTYEGTDAEGVAFSMTFNEDGTFTDSSAGEVVRTGTWTHDDVNGTCIVEEGLLEEAEPMCFEISEAAEDGTVTVTNADGESMTMSKTD